MSKIPDDGIALFPVANSQAPNAGEVAYYHQWHLPVPLRFSARSRFALRCSFVALLGGFVWAVTVPIGGAFMAQGRLVADGRNQVVDTLEGGMVQTVFFREGDQVKSGDVLARMDVTNASVSLANATHQRDINRIKLVRLLAEQNDLSEIRWPKDLAALIGRDRELADTAKTQLQEFESKKRELSATQEILKQRIESNLQLVGSLEELRDERVGRIAETERELQVSEKLFAKGLTTRDRNFSLKRQLASDQDQMRQTLLQIAEKRSTISQTEEQDNQLISQRENEVADGILQLQAQIFELSGKMQALQAMVDRSDIRAPVDGAVVNVAVNTQNQVIEPGRPLFEIFPSGVPLSVEVQVVPQNIDGVVIGQKIAVQFQSREHTKARLMIDGEVTYVSPDSTLDTHTGLYNYTVRARLSAESIQAYGDVIPGNVATVYFQLTKQTFAQYLLDPYWNMGQKAFVG